MLAINPLLGFTLAVVLGSASACGKDKRTGATRPAAPLAAELEPFRAQCASSTTGTIIGLEALLQARRPGVPSSVRQLDLAQYCGCYLAGLEQAVGVERTAAYARGPGHLDGEALIAVATAADSVRLACVDAAPPRDGADHFITVFAAPFVSGRGLGGVTIGIGVAELRRVLGPTNLVSTGRIDTYRYGDNGIELVVQVSPPGEGGRVVAVKVNRSYRGVTDHGFKIGDRYADLESRLGDIVFREANRVLLCRDGTRYQFNDSGGLDGLSVVTAESDPLMKFYGGH